MPFRAGRFGQGNTKGGIQRLNIKKNYLTKNRCFINGKKRKANGIQIHSIGTGQNTAQSVADYWNQSAVSACVTYICDAEKPGLVLQCLPEDYYTWADAGWGNRELITIEMCESDGIKYTGNGAEYKITNESMFKADVLRSYWTAVELCADICKRYGWNPEAKLSNGMYLISSHDEGRRAGLSSAHVDPSHIWPRFGLSMEQFRKDVAAYMKNPNEKVPYSIEPEWYRVRLSWENEKTQLGAYEILENAKANCPAGYSVFDSKGKVVFKREAKGTQATSLNGLSEAEKIRIVAPLYQEVARETGMLASVGLAQFALESGYGTTDLAQRANNLHGMKCSLSGNTWSGSSWDGVSKYNKRTAEQDKYGNEYYIYADFRKYPCIEDSIADRAAYYMGAMNGSKRRYPGIENITNAEEQVKAIKAGGYATDVKYVDKLLNIINRFSLKQYDVPKDEKPVPTPAKTPTEKAVDRAVEICNDDSHGYDNTKGKRTGNPDFACSSFVAECWRYAGLNIPADEYTSNMLKDFKAAGFEDVSNKVDLKTGAGTIAGDVLLIPGKHVEMVVDGKHRLAGARGNATGGAENGKAGDQTGQEIAVSDWFDFGWKYCLRYTGKEAQKEEKTVYRVQVGAYSQTSNRDSMQRLLKQRLDLDCFSESDASNIYLYCGSFENKAKAEERLMTVRKVVPKAFIKEARVKI